MPPVTHCIISLLVALLFYTTPMVSAQTTTTPTPADSDPCVYNAWNGTITFTCIIGGTILGSMLLGLGIGWAVSESKSKNWKWPFAWGGGATQPNANEMLLKRVIVAPIQR